MCNSVIKGACEQTVPSGAWAANMTSTMAVFTDKAFQVHMLSRSVWGGAIDGFVLLLPNTPTCMSLIPDVDLGMVKTVVEMSHL